MGSGDGGTPGLLAEQGGQGDQAAADAHQEEGSGLGDGRADDRHGAVEGGVVTVSRRGRESDGVTIGIPEDVRRRPPGRGQESMLQISLPGRRPGP